MDWVGGMYWTNLLFQGVFPVLILLGARLDLLQACLLLLELLVVGRFFLHQSLQRGGCDCEGAWWRHFDVRLL